MLPAKLRFELIERMSVKTMRYVSAVPRAKADGLVARIYDMIAEDFFINGSLTGHSKVPSLLAGVWTGGRESILVVEDEPPEILSRNLSSAGYLLAGATAFFFVSFLFAYFYLRSLNSAGLWKPKGVDASVAWGSVVMACVVVSAGLIRWGLIDHRAVRRSAWPQVDRLQGDHGLGEWLTAHPEEVLDVEVPGKNDDVDTAERLQRLREEALPAQPLRDVPPDPPPPTRGTHRPPDVVGGGRG